MKPHMAQEAIKRLEGFNADNRMVLDALEAGRIGTGRQVLGDTTEETKEIYRKRIAEIDDLIALIRAGAL